MSKYPKPRYCWFFHDWLVTSTQLVKMAGVHDYLVTVRWCATAGNGKSHG